MRLVSGLATRIVWIALALGSQGAPAADSTPLALSAAQYQHTAWLAKDGAPAPIRALAQTDDGYLWLGTEEGLYRFDGQTFELVPTPGGPAKVKPYVGSLLAEPGGGLWVGFRRGGGLGHLKDGKFTRFGATVNHDVDDLSADREGHLWFVLAYDLARLTADRIEHIDSRWNVAGSVENVLVDRAGNVWVRDAKEHLLLLAPGASRFEVVIDHQQLASMALDGNGNLWGPGVHGLWHIDPGADPRSMVQSVPSEEFGTTMFDREGGLWVQRNGGLSRVSNAMALTGSMLPHGSEVFAMQQGLSSETIWAMLQDRDGNVWTATSKGLDRFRRTPFTPVKLPGHALSFVTAPAGGGAVWAANWRGSLLKVGTDQVQEHPSIGPGIRFIYRDPQDALWVGGGSGLWRSIDDTGFSKFPVDPDFIADSLRAIGVDKAGGLWLTGGGSNFAKHVVDGQWTTPSEADGFPQKWNAACFTNDGEGRVWGCAGNDAIRIENGKGSRLSAMGPGLDIGRVSTISVHGSHVWLGGYTGLAVFDGRRTLNLTRANGKAFDNVGGIVEVSNGDVWLHDRTSATRIPAASLRQALAKAGGPVDTQAFTETDGLYGVVSATAPLPSLTQGDDGRLWFATDAGLAWVWPDRPERSERIPPVRIRTLLADGQSYPADATALLPPRNQHAEMSYAAIALSTPERVRFRYKLEGIGGDWQDAGTRRTAYFNNLAPGRYTFRVRSTDEQGEWRGNEASLEFRVDAAWYQTVLFQFACLAVAVGLLWGAFRLRERQVSQRVLAREEVKQVERNRIARDLHDTFLQSVQSLMWQFQDLSVRLPDDGRTRAELDRALALAEQVVADGRDRVIALRHGSPGGRNLPDELGKTWSEISGDSHRELDLRVRGQPRPLCDEVHGEVLQVLREALVNVHRHAQASNVEVVLDYGARTFVASVIDDGVGIPADIVENGKFRHYGLSGMRERAAELKAKLSIRGGPGSGTTVQLRLKATRAYAVVDDTGLA
jgi:signal transduction histidine kinase/ligand-binding sensor domain-containing protein